MSLADVLFEDFEEDDDDDQEKQQFVSDKESYVENVAMEVDTQSNSVNKFAKLRDSDLFTRVMAEIEKNPTPSSNKNETYGPVESDPRYKLIVEANSLSVEIDHEINRIHMYVKDAYSKRFPQLLSLIPIPLEYISTVRELGNNIHKAKNNQTLQQFLKPTTMMVLNMVASTTQGLLLNEEELGEILEACQTAIELNENKLQMYHYVESCMSFIAPNLSAILGSAVAAKLMGAAGGLTSLIKMPACNVLVLGCQSRTLSGFSSASTLPHTGFIYYSEFVQRTPVDLRRKAARYLAAKCTLAARIDNFHQSRDGNEGKKFLKEIEAKLEKLQEAPPLKQVKPLPAPIDQPKKKRGGKRARKAKQRYGMTEMRKQANRMNFGEIEEDAFQTNIGFSLGQIGKSGSGRIRATAVDEKTKVRISKTLQKSLQREQISGVATSTRKRGIDTASSTVDFTPLHGLEIINPQAVDKKVEEMNNKYFSSSASFIYVK